MYLCTVPFIHTVTVNACYILSASYLGLRFSLKEDEKFLEYYYQPLHVPPTVTDDFSSPFCFPTDMIVKFLQKLHSATLS